VYAIKLVYLYMAAVPAWDDMSTKLSGGHRPLLFPYLQNSASVQAPSVSVHLTYWHPHTEDTAKQRTAQAHLTEVHN
jgi:hypothetical protein